MKRKGWDDQMRGITINQVHIRSGDEWRGWDGMIRWEVLKTIDQIHVQAVEMKRMEMECDDQKIQIIDQVHLRTGDEWREWDGMIRWEGMEMEWDDQMRSIQTIDQVHVLSGDG
jgi:hypothetical protein